MWQAERITVSIQIANFNFKSPGCHFRRNKRFSALLFKFSKVSLSVYSIFNIYDFLLQAHFIDRLPDISSLSTTLVHINLSFNYFTVRSMIAVVTCF